METLTPSSPPSKPSFVRRRRVVLFVLGGVALLLIGVAAGQSKTTTTTTAAAPVTTDVAPTTEAPTTTTATTAAPTTAPPTTAAPAAPSIELDPAQFVAMIEAMNPGIVAKTCAAVAEARTSGVTEDVIRVIGIGSMNGAGAKVGITDEQLVDALFAAC